MATIDNIWARSFAQAWVDAWNAHDLERILSHYAEGVEFRSPFAIHITGEASGTLRGRSSLRAYWGKALGLLPDLHFNLVDTMAGVDSLTVYYQGHRGMVAETFFFDASRQIISAVACYSVQSPQPEAPKETS
ncbi:MAG: nuclear transport factor 2 family protein [Pseudomonadota bacterium]|nr:nuclear transport factor 2 family protein [Pseudomonadota bacterium]